MNTWCVLVILTVGLVLITKGKENRVLSAYPEFLLQVEKCNSYNTQNSNKNPWLTASDERLCKNLLHSNENTLDDYLNRLNYETDDFDFGDSEQMQQRTSSSLLAREGGGGSGGAGHQQQQQQQKHLLKIFGNEKRGISGTGMGCDCQIKNDIIDLGYSHFPRYLFNAVCQDNQIAHGDDDGLGGPGGGAGAGDEPKLYGRKCWRGSQCKPVEYKVRVLTHRTKEDFKSISDHSVSLLPDVLRPDWKFKTVTVAAGCFCSF